MSIGKNTIAGELLRNFVERIEMIDVQKKDLSIERAAVMAEAKAQGLVPKAIAHVIRVRAMKPHDRAEAEALADMYLHAMGLDSEPPLFRAVGLMDVDIHARESVVEAMRKFVPADGEIIVRVGKSSERLWRDKDGEVHNEPVLPAKERPEPQQPASARSARPPAPDVDDQGAFELGRQAAVANQPVISNPFPFGDTRRARFDEGWRSENGGDGMGGD
jgi:uncharacterized protein (UPF0335 family)